jgi:spore maturation protein CgeB
MKLVIFGLTISSSWGNGHATLWRGLTRALAARGHRVVFFEKDVPYYAETRDLTVLPGGGTLYLYSTFSGIRAQASAEVQDADLAIATSYCPDGREAARVVLDSPAGVKAFYDLDSPVTLGRWKRGEDVAYLPEEGLGDFDLVLSYTGGKAVDELADLMGAKRVEPLYGSVDPTAHFPVPVREEYRADLSYLGTYAADRQAALEELFLAPAKRLPKQRFVIGGAQYPADFPWSENIFFVRHMPPSLHPAFFCSSRATLNVTRSAMAEYGDCPSGRLFEAAACGTAIITDAWPGLAAFFAPGREVLVVETTEDVTRALELSDRELQRIARAARERVLTEHTAEARVRQLETICKSIDELRPAMRAKGDSGASGSLPLPVAV